MSPAQAAKVLEEKRKRRELLKANRAHRRSALAQKIDDGAMLLAAIAFHIHRLPIGQWTDAAVINAETFDLTRKWKKTLKAARRLLRVEYKDGAFLLPTTFASRITEELLINVDDVWKLNPHLNIDYELRAFAERHPHIVTEARRVLNEDVRHSTVTSRVDADDQASSVHQFFSVAPSAHIAFWNQ